MKKPVQYLSLLAVLAATTASLCLAFARADSKGAMISRDGATVETLDVRFDDMAPGVVKSSSVSFSLAKGYELFASFQAGEGLLNDYVQVSIDSGSVRESAALKSLLGSEEISLGQDVERVEVSYSLPLDSGNETQNQHGSFRVDFVARAV